MHEIGLTADQLSSALLTLSKTEPVSILDSCGVGGASSNLMIAGVGARETAQLNHPDPDRTLSEFESIIHREDTAAIFTISYTLGIKLNGIVSRHKDVGSPFEPDIFVTSYDSLIVFDYNSQTAFLTGNPLRFHDIERKLIPSTNHEFSSGQTVVSSNFSRDEYILAIDQIKEYIRRGDTYQTNLTQQIRAEFPGDITPQSIFSTLRKDHPAPFAAFIVRPASTVVSASPERFLRWRDGTLTVSPIKGTRRRGETSSEDLALRNGLLESDKDRAENVMIVDLLRNDIGRVCKFGSVTVEDLCKLEVHPSLFHLVSTISGEIRDGITVSDILRAAFPCGSITGAPKIRTMQIIDQIESSARGLSMGAIGWSHFGGQFEIEQTLDMSVAIRTMTIRGRDALFNLGGGIVIDSDPESEYDETLIKGQALLSAIEGELSPAQ
ncbi:MAG: aminodeoxychorismate synthase component I [Pyrinomonadaceae bacterium]